MKRIGRTVAVIASLMAVTSGVALTAAGTRAEAAVWSSGAGPGPGSAPHASMGAQTPTCTFTLPNNVKVMTVADPPMGQEYSGLGAIVVPAGVTWRLVGFTYNITFDVTKPGTGNVSLIIRDPDGNSHLRVPLANGLDRASRYVDFSGWVGAPQGPTQSIDSECIVASIPDLVLPSGWQYTTLTSNRKTTDRIKEMQLWVEEMPA